MKQGILISWEGNDGAGKTTVCLKVKEKLEEMGYPVLYTREPGGSKIAEAIRDLLLDPDHTEMDPRTEALLYAASRRQHLVERILPALEEKKIVLCDRFIDSSLAYQGIGRGLGLEPIWTINEFAIEGKVPDHTLFLSVSMETGQARMNGRGDKNRLDQEEEQFHQKVRQGYEKLIEMYPERISVIDAEPELEQVVQSALNQVLEVISRYE